MARPALALHADGLWQRDVVRECYGADLPYEFFAIAADLPVARRTAIEFHLAGSRAADRAADG